MAFKFYLRRYTTGVRSMLFHPDGKSLLTGVVRHALLATLSTIQQTLAN